MIQISQSSAIGTVETNLRKLARSERNVDIRIPHKLRDDDLGGHAALLQLIATWARHSPEGAVGTYVEPNRRTQQINRLIASDHGLMSILMADRLLDRDGNDITLETRQTALARMRASNQPFAPRRGNRFAIVAADHTSMQAAPRALYQSNEITGANEVAGAPAFQLLARRCIETATVGESKRATLHENRKALGRLIRELFANTDDWAKYTTKGAIRPSVRLVRAEGFGRTIRDLERIASGDTPIERYIAGPHFIREPFGRQQYLEIDVLDTGEGLAKLRLDALDNSNPTIQEEFEAALWCLKLHNTTWPGADRIVRGVGLHRALEKLTELHAFVRVRTGRLSLYRDLLSEPYDPSTTGEPYLRDWLTSDRSPTTAENATGTLFTIILPTAWGPNRPSPKAG